MSEETNHSDGVKPAVPSNPTGQAADHKTGGNTMTENDGMIASGRRSKRQLVRRTLHSVVRFLDGFIWLRIDALDNAVLRWRRLGKYRRWWEPRHAPLRLLHAALVYAWLPFYRRAKTDWQIHESNPAVEGRREPTTDPKKG